MRYLTAVEDSPPGAARWIPVAEPNLCGREREYVLDCIDTGWVSSRGAYVDRFEAAFAAFCGAPHAIAVANGTCALHLALIALGVGPGDEVIVPALTYVATVNAVRYVGATPVFVDSDPATWNIDPAKVAEAITSRTRAVIPVHLYGNPCDMQALGRLADAHGLAIVENAAEAFGSRYRGRMSGSLGTIGTFSFFGNKTITTGEGGMVVTADAELARRVRLYKTQGVSPGRQYDVEVVGYNYRMTNPQAAIGLAQLENGAALVAAKRAVADRYRERLLGVAGLRVQAETPSGFNSTWMFSLVVEDGFGLDRDGVMARLLDRGVETRPVFPACHRLAPYRDEALTLPVAEDLSRRGLNLPSSTRLSVADVDYVADCLLECRRRS